MFSSIYKSLLGVSITLILAVCQTAATVDQSEFPAQPEKPLQSSNPGSLNRTPFSSNITIDTGQREAPLPVTSVWQRIRLGLQLTNDYLHTDVNRQPETYGNNQRCFDSIAERARPSLFGLVEEKDGRGLPMELAMLPVIASTFNPTAYSHAHAVGLWQFLGPTGVEFGLQQDWWYDGRRDPENSTRAALDHLKQLYTQFDNDWLLTLAAYNTGGANVNRALRHSNNNASFWDLRLATETRTHTPKLLALSRIIVRPQDYGVNLPEIPNHNPLVSVDTGAQIDLARVAELIELPVEDLKSLNPEDMQWAIRPQAPQTIAIPFELKGILVKGLSDLNPSQFVTWEHYEIRGGDTLGAIARKLNTAVDGLPAVNRLYDTQIIAGESLLIPHGIGASDYTSIPTIDEGSADEGPAAVSQQHTVQSGDNWIIAHHYDLRSQEIADHNSLPLDALLHPGQILDLSYAATSMAIADNTDTLPEKESPGIYRVRRSDSMQKIADQPGTDLEDLLERNGII